MHTRRWRLRTQLTASPALWHLVERSMPRSATLAGITMPGLMTHVSAPPLALLLPPMTRSMRRRQGSMTLAYVLSKHLCTFSANVLPRTSSTHTSSPSTTCPRAHTAPCTLRAGGRTTAPTTANTAGRATTALARAMHIPWIPKIRARSNLLRP